MKSFLIHKNQSFYYWLRRRIGKGRAFRVANRVEKIILNIDMFFEISFLMIAGIFLLWFILVSLVSFQRI
jgi:hypothetical protein